MPREGHDINTFLTGGVYLISIHVPREGHDVIEQCLHDGDGWYFNPRAPRGARLDNIRLGIEQAGISIHVPREGHDDGSNEGWATSENFNPRAPRGARHPIVPP